ncbi:SAF domain-containing protein [Siccirubricoccus deserti]
MAFGLAGFGTVAWISFRPPVAPAAAITPAAAPVHKTAVVAAARELRAGTLLKPEDLSVREIPKRGAGGRRARQPRGQAWPHWRHRAP